MADNPSACGKCHVMQPYVNSYYSSDFLDSLHSKTQRPVKCDDCHKESLIQQSKEVLAFVTGKYQTPITQRPDTQSACVACHPVSQIADPIRNDPKFVEDSKLSYHLTQEKGRVGCYDPRVSIMRCEDCHRAHEPAVNYCIECHYVEFQAPNK